MQHDDGTWLRVAWPLVASLSGAITALSFQPYRNMSPVQVFMSLIVGTSFAYFVGPLAAHFIFRDGPIDTRLYGSVLYLMATGSNVLIPLLVKWLARFFGTGDQT